MKQVQKFEDCSERYKEEVLAIMRQDVVDSIMTKLGKMTPELFKELTNIDYE